MELLLRIFTFHLLATRTFGFKPVEYLKEHKQTGYHDRDGPVFLTDETRLHNDLFSVRRLTHPTSEGLDVHFGLSLISIIDYNAADEIIVIHAFARQAWVNPELTWDPEEYGGIERINVAPDKTWVPDVYAYGNVEVQFLYNGMLDTMKTHVIVHSTGAHFWLAPVVMHLGCGMNVDLFPFDTQICPLHFGSFTYDRSKLNLIPTVVDMSRYTDSSEWTFGSMNHTREVVVKPGIDVPFAHVKYTIICVRKPLYYFRNVFLPIIGLSFLVLLVFIQPIESGERCIYTMTVVSALNWLLASATLYLPPTGEGTPLSQAFLAASLVVMVLVSIFLCYSFGIFYGYSGSKKMSKCFRKYVLGILGKYLGFKHHRCLPVWRERLIQIREMENNGRGGFQNNTKRKTRQTQAEKIEELVFKLKTSTTVLQSPDGNLKETLEKMLGLKTISQLNYKLETLLLKFEEEEEEEWQKREWKAASLILDRLFLHLFRGFMGLMLVYSAVYVLF